MEENGRQRKGVRRRTPSGEGLVGIVLLDGEVTQLVLGLVGRDASDVITKLMFLEVFLREILQISLRELNGGGNRQVVLVGVNLDRLIRTNVPGETLDLNTPM